MLSAWRRSRPVDPNLRHSTLEEQVWTKTGRRIKGLQEELEADFIIMCVYERERVNSLLYSSSACLKQKRDRTSYITLQRNSKNNNNNSKNETDTILRQEFQQKQQGDYSQTRSHTYANH